ncbi:MAG: CBS domain-containing protein [Burkholderiales bacterium]|nr:CBS domain-containing protein [Burkholderiales bacterium]
MFSRSVREVIDRNRLVTCGGDASVRDAAGLMRSHGVGAILVMAGDSLAGILTERDIACRVVACDRDPGSTLLSEVMTAAPLTISPDRSFGHALTLMHDHGFRHLPVVENGRPIGIVSARNALDPDLEEFVAESMRREQFRRESN